ncbi:MAG: hypothetical protein K2Q26_11320 [Bdellovibrionales bacterium]|nr:hypothetical protein [Bdellovibrionales bacterium]
MKVFKKYILLSLIAVAMAIPKPAKADLFGGDVAVLVQILANAVQQLAQLKQLLSTGEDTLSLLRDINKGIRDGLAVMQMINPKFNPGIYGSLDTADKVLNTINDLYGSIPQTAEARLQQAQDQSASESIAMNGTLFQFADDADAESRRIFAHSQDVSPQGAAKLTAQSVAVLIGVTSQVLRTNSMILKNMGESAALQNRKEKLQSAQFKTQYDQLSQGIGSLPAEPKLGSLGGL